MFFPPTPRESHFSHLNIKLTPSFRLLFLLQRRKSLNLFSILYSHGSDTHPRRHIPQNLSILNRLCNVPCFWMLRNIQCDLGLRIRQGHYRQYMPCINIHIGCNIYLSNLYLNQHIVSLINTVLSGLIFESILQKPREKALSSSPSSIELFHRCRKL